MGSLDHSIDRSTGRSTTIPVDGAVKGVEEAYGLSISQSGASPLSTLSYGCQVVIFRWERRSELVWVIVIRPL